MISIHALLAESDVIREPASRRHDKFLSTLSLRRATKTGSERINRDIAFLSTLSLRRATVKGKPACAGYLHFYPRSPCGERLFARHVNGGGLLFLSTLSLRRATDTNSPCKPCRTISIHALLAESDDTSGATSLILRAFLSTLSLRRATSLAALLTCPPLDFYPRSPCGERLLGRAEVVSRM